MYITSGKSLLAVVMLYLIISGNYLTEVLGCSMQRLLSNNQIVKHIAAFITLYVFVIFANDTSDNMSHPIDSIKHTIIVYIVFLTTTRVHTYYSIPIALLIIAVIFIQALHSYKLHRLAKGIVYSDNKLESYIMHNYDNIIKYMIIAIYGLCAIGYVHYLIEKRNEYRGNWSWKQFLLGVNKCKSL